MEISEQEPVLDIKKRLEQFLQIPTSSITLFVSCWELLDGLDIDDYPIISHGTRIDLTVTPLFTAPSFTNPAVKKIHITVKFPSKQFAIEVDKTETVSSLKDKIHIVENTPIKRMQLYFSGVELADDFRNLNEYGIGEFSEIVVFLKSINRAKDVAPVRKLCFLVQTSSSLFNGARIPVEINDSCTILEMREGLQANKTLPRDEYIFVHKQRIMRENCSLRWHGVENGDTLFVFKGSISRGSY
ncbi:Ubiquitin-like superfamily protein [Hirschfeldia incana]|nr:Ubiquitin-like superfamily protein [Hirschfeldia incana]